MGETVCNSVGCITLVTQVSVCTQAKIGISGNFVSTNDIQTPAFHPTMHKKSINPSWCSKCKCIIIRDRLTRIQLKPLN